MATVPDGADVPFKLAPSDLTFLWEECPRCFWLKAKGVLKFIEYNAVPKEWLKSGALVIVDDQGWDTMDGELRGCSQTVTIAFDAKHKASVLRVADKKPKEY